MTVRSFVLCLLLVSPFAHADRAHTKKPMKPPAPIVARVVGLEVFSEEGAETAVVTVLAGSEQGIGKHWHARFREGDTTQVLTDGDAMIIRIDRQATILKTALSAQQIRANRFVVFEP